MNATRTKADAVEDFEVFEQLEALKEDELSSKGMKLPDNGFVKPMNAGPEEGGGDPTRKIRIFLTATGEPRDVPYWTLEGKNSILRRRTADGAREFSVKQPENAEWVQGQILCYLHKDHPRRKELRDMGLAGKTCIAGHLASEFDLRMHMQNKHRKEWAVVQEYETRQRENEYRDFQRIQAEAARATIDAANAAAAASVAATKSKAKPAEGE